jgi:hypothetical protein
MNYYDAVGIFPMGHETGGDLKTWHYHSNWTIALRHGRVSSPLRHRRRRGRNRPITPLVFSIPDSQNLEKTSELARPGTRPREATSVKQRHGPASFSHRHQRRFDGGGRCLLVRVGASSRWMCTDYFDFQIASPSPRFVSRRKPSAAYPLYGMGAALT